MTRYEYYVKKSRDGHLRNEDVRLILVLGRNIEYPTLKQKEEALKIIKEKNINVSVFGVSMMRARSVNKDGDKAGVKYYNCFCKRVNDCITREQWETVRLYYCSAVDKTDTEVNENA